MLTEKYIKVTLTAEEKGVLLKSAEIIDELFDAMGEIISTAGYDDIDLGDLRDAIKAIAYEGTFEINESYN